MIPRKQFAVLCQIKNDYRITKDTEAEFLYHLQNGLLLTLKEQGRLNAMQYRYAEEKLRSQHRDRVKKIMKKGESG